MKAVGLHPDVVVVTSRFWQTTCTLVRSGEEAFCIDSPVLPDELEILPSIAEQARFRVVGLLRHPRATWTTSSAATRSRTRRWASASRPRSACRPSRGACSGAARLRRGVLHRARRAAVDAGAAGAAGAGPVRDRRRGARAAPAPGHTADGMAIWIPWARVLVCGDYLSPVEIPWLPSAARARTTSRRSTASSRSSSRPSTSCPATARRSTPCARAAILREDREYLQGLPDSKLPLARRTRRAEEHPRREREAGGEARAHGPSAARPALHARHRPPEGQGRAGRLEHLRSRAGRPAPTRRTRSGATATSSSRAATRSSSS